MSDGAILLRLLLAELPFFATLPDVAVAPAVVAFPLLHTLTLEVVAVAHQILHALLQGLALLQELVAVAHQVVHKLFSWIVR